LGSTTISSPVSVTVNAQPAVTINSPTNNASFDAPTNITITATASDVDGTVSRVDFFEGFNLLGSDSSSPYSIVWSNVVSGTYSLTAVAIDNSSATATSSVVQIQVATNIIAIEDAHVRGGTNASVNYGSVNPIEVQTNSTAVNNRDAYFKFNLGSVSNISRVKLRVSAKLSAA